MDDDPEPFRHFPFQPKGQVNGSWWTLIPDPDRAPAWYALAQAELPRMQGSSIALRLHSKCVDDL